MKYLFFILIFFLYKATILSAQPDSVQHRIILIGDAGELTREKHPVVSAVKLHIPLDEKTTVIYLGDNLYKTGLPDDEHSKYLKEKAVLDSQLNLADNTPARIFMIPGNHDWNNGKRGGYEAILRQQKYADSLNKKNVHYYPKDGCPGPKEIFLNEQILLIMFDSQWWLHPHEKPGLESDCKSKTPEELVDNIEDIIKRNPQKLIVLACHHPFKSNGIHGGYFTLKQHIFPFTDLKDYLYIPLPVIGSAYPIARSLFGVPQDIVHPLYSRMVNEITEAVRRRSRNVIFVSGHDHNLQLIQEDGYNYIVSGSGCKENRTARRKNSLFNSTFPGFVVIDVNYSKEVYVTFYELKDSLVKSSPMKLLNFSENKIFAGSEKEESNPISFSHSGSDSVSVSIEKNFPELKGLRRFVMGNGYRSAWTTPVNMKLFRLKNDFGGFEVITMGGGRQTRSLRMKNNITGEEWVLRIMNKSPVQTIPKEFQSPLISNLALELKSATFPFGSFVVSGLSSALGIRHSEPKLVFVPDDTALGMYRPFFRNTVCLLERRPSPDDDIPAVSTAKMMDKILDEHDHRPWQEEILKARLLDFLVADYDRHFDQWRWLKADTGKGKIYIPLPRDRDQSFFYSDGFLLKALSRGKTPFLYGFRSRFKKVRWLGYQSRDFDRMFLTDLDKKDWLHIISEIRSALNDSTIKNAVKSLPPEISRSYYNFLASTLIKRRDQLEKQALNYYRFLSRYINIVGSHQREYFKIKNSGNGLHVRVYGIGNDNDTPFIMYDRIFYPQETKEIRLFGLNHHDVFEVEENTVSPIKIRMIGGKGTDTFDIKGNTRTLLYDVIPANGQTNYVIKNHKRTVYRFSKDPAANEQNILGFQYNSLRFPVIYTGYNSDDGFIIGAGLNLTRHGFRKFPYASRQRFSALYAPYRNALRLRYTGEFNQIIGKSDLVFRADFYSTVMNNFFGWGNSASINTSKPRRFYHTLYRYGEWEFLFRKTFFDKVFLTAGPWISYYAADKNKNTNTILKQAAGLGLDTLSVFSTLWYGGVKADLVIDNRNHALFPTRGVYWRNEYLNTRLLQGDHRAFVSFRSDFHLYISKNDPAKGVSILKFGGGKIYSSRYEYFQSMTLGAEQELWGFRKQRFAGKSSLYSSLELRHHLFHLNSYILPGPVGITGFYHVGRVWHPGDINGAGKWHSAYGAGIYFLPLHSFYMAAQAGFSGNQPMLFFTLGSALNLIF
ncbi:MAG: metallophosphoesterase [Chitinophagaceae bacterium]|nr:metallophosphoesterase [Chitinophagaceae bacterium]